MFYIGVYAAVGTYQFFEDLQSHLILLSQITVGGSFLCYSFYKMVSNPLGEKILSSRLSAGIYFVRIATAAASSICIILTTH